MYINQRGVERRILRYLLNNDVPVAAAYMSTPGVLSRSTGLVSVVSSLHSAVLGS